MLAAETARGAPGKRAAGAMIAAAVFLEVSESPGPSSRAPELMIAKTFFLV